MVSGALGCVKVRVEGRDITKESESETICVSDIKFIFLSFGCINQIALTSYGCLLEYQSRYFASDAFECMNDGLIDGCKVNVKFYRMSLESLLDSCEWGGYELVGNDEEKTIKGRESKTEDRYYKNDNYSKRSDERRKRHDHRKSRP